MPEALLMCYPRKHVKEVAAALAQRRYKMTDTAHRHSWHVAAMAKGEPFAICKDEDCAEILLPYSIDRRLNEWEELRRWNKALKANASKSVLRRLEVQLEGDDA